MPRKVSKTTLKRKLDKEISRIVRARGVCAWCGSQEYDKFQAAHIFSRSMMSVRFDLKNILCLCAGCHFKAHRNPILFVEFVQEHLGDYEYHQLKARARSIKQWEVWELETLLDNLKSLK